MNNYELLLKFLEEHLQVLEAKYEDKKRMFSEEDKKLELEIKAKEQRIKELNELMNSKIFSKLSTLNFFKPLLREYLNNFLEDFKEEMPFFLSFFLISSAVSLFAAGPYFYILSLPTTLLIMLTLSQSAGWIYKVLHLLFVKILYSQDKDKWNEEFSLFYKEKERLEKKISDCKNILSAHQGILIKYSHYITVIKTEYIPQVFKSLEYVRQNETDTARINEYYFDDRVVDTVLKWQSIGAVEYYHKRNLRKESFTRVRKREEVNNG